MDFSGFLELGFWDLALAFAQKWRSKRNKTDG